MSSVTSASGTVVNDATIGTVAWINVNNVKTDDSDFASASLPAGAQSNYIKCTNFSFGSIPASATITGVLLGIKRSKSPTGGIPESKNLQLVVGGVLSGTTKSDSASWPTTETLSTYGGDGDLWGLVSLTVSQVQNSGFGVVVDCKETQDKSNSADVQVYYIYLQVFYTAPGGIGFFLI